MICISIRYVVDCVCRLIISAVKPVCEIMMIDINQNSAMLDTVPTLVQPKPCIRFRLARLSEYDDTGKQIFGLTLLILTRAQIVSP